jgi:hypothetical protein
MPLKTVPMPARVPAIVQALYAQHVDLAEGDDDQRRALQMLVCEQARFELGPAYGAKKSGGGPSVLEGSIAYLAPDGVLYAADCFNGSTRKPAVPSVFEEIGGQVFIPVQSVDHLGAATGGGSTPAPVPAGYGDSWRGARRHDRDRSKRDRVLVARRRIKAAQDRGARGAAGRRQRDGDR